MPDFSDTPISTATLARLYPPRVRTRTRIGTRDACAACDSDVEYHGRGVWLDRGGNGYCDTSGAILFDGDGCPVKLPHQRHRPTP